MPMATSHRRSPAGAATIALALIAVAVFLMSGCSSSSRQANDVSAAASSTTSAEPGSGSATSTQATGATAPDTVPGEIRGTATDFCSALAEGGVRVTGAAGAPVASLSVIINEWVADMVRFAPEALRAQVAGITTQLLEVSKNIQLGLISTNDGVAAAMGAMAASPDRQALASYAQANCPGT